MAFRDYSQQFAPVNVFGGLGKGLGEGLGAGVTKAIKRPLFKSLADNYRNKRLEQAKLSTLGELGLQKAPMTIEDTQYPIFQQMVEQKMAPVDERFTTSLNLFEAGDPQAARDYLLTEPKVGPGARDKKLTAGEQKMQAMQSPAAVAKYNEIKANREMAGDIANNWQAKGLTAEQAQGQISQLNTDRQNLLNEYFQMTGTDLKDQTWNQYAGLIEKQLGAEGQFKKNIQIVEGEKAKVLKQAQDFANNRLEKNSKLAKWMDEMASLSTSEAALKGYIDNFDTVKENPSVFFGAVKELANIIEPGLQVTEGEANAFMGRSVPQEIINAIRQTGAAAKGFFKNWSAQEAEFDAGKDSPVALWNILVQATNLLHDTQQAYKGLMDDAQLRAGFASDANVSTLVDQNKLLDGEQKASIKQAVTDNIFSQFPTFGESIEKIPYGTPMPGTEAPQQFDAQGNEISLTDEPGAAGDQQRAARATETSNPIQAQASQGAAEMSDKVIDDLLSQGGY